MREHFDNLPDWYVCFNICAVNKAKRLEADHKRFSTQDSTWAKALPIGWMGACLIASKYSAELRFRLPTARLVGNDERRVNRNYRRFAVGIGLNEVKHRVVVTQELRGNQLTCAGITFDYGGARGIAGRPR
jgi:hypothetical protein